MVGSKAYRIMVKWWEQKLYQAEQDSLYRNKEGDWNKGYQAGQLSLCKQLVDDLKAAKTAKDNGFKLRDKMAEAKEYLRKSIISDTR